MAGLEDYQRGLEDEESKMIVRMKDYERMGRENFIQGRPLSELIATTQTSEGTRPLFAEGNIPPSILTREGRGLSPAPTSPLEPYYGGNPLLSRDEQSLVGRYFESNPAIGASTTTPEVLSGGRRLTTSEIWRGSDPLESALSQLPPEKQAEYQYKNAQLTALERYRAGELGIKELGELIRAANLNREIAADAEKARANRAREAGTERRTGVIEKGVEARGTQRQKDLEAQRRELTTRLNRLTYKGKAPTREADKKEYDRIKKQIDDITSELGGKASSSDAFTSSLLMLGLSPEELGIPAE